MTARWSRWGATGGVVLCLLWAPMGLIVPQLPDLGSPAAIEHFHRSHEALLKAVLLLASCGFFFLLCFLGALVERLRRAEGAGPLTWIAAPASWRSPAPACRSAGNGRPPARWVRVADRPACGPRGQRPRPATPAPHPRDSGYQP